MASKQKIEVKCDGTHYLPLSELFILQDTDNFQLKTLNPKQKKKLQNMIVKYGFWFPFFVWHCGEENRWYYTDGTQRHKVLTDMAESKKFELPDKFPCVEIFAKDKKEAAESILAQSSRYGEMTVFGLDSFTKHFNIDLPALKDDWEFPNFNFEELNQINAIEEWKGMPEYTETEVKAYKTIACHFDNDQEIENFAQMINRKVTPKTKYLDFPPKERVAYPLCREGEDLQDE